MVLDFPFMATHAPALLAGLGVTVFMVAISLAAGLILGVAIALVRRLGFGPLNALLRAYIEVLRGTPLLVQLFVLYYGGPSIGLVLGAYEAGALGLTLYTSAYLAEIVRAGLESIPRGQIEAARMLGFTRAQIFARIEAPQMLTLIVPPSTNQMISVTKESAVLSVITVPELTFNTTRVVSQTFVVVEPYLMLGLSYWLLTSLLAWASGRLERSFQRP